MPVCKLQYERFETVLTSVIKSCFSCGFGGGGGVEP